MFRLINTGRGRFALLISAALLGTASVAEAELPVEAPILNPSRLAPMDWAQARERTLAWLADQPEAAKTRLAASPAPDSARGRHERVIQIFSRADPPTAKLLTALDPRNVSFPPPDPTMLLEIAENAFYRTNLAIEAMRMLVDRRLFDEALAISAHVDPSQAIDPASWLFYRAVCQHQLLMREEGLASVEQLLDASWPVPESYRAVAELMRVELEALKPDTLGEIAALMDDVERRLELARGGTRVQQQEEEIAKKLEKMIEELEKQQQQQQQKQAAAGNAGNQNQSSNPLNDSIVKGSTAPGEVDDKGKMRGGDWGNLPAREREAARIELEKAFPSNYSRLINEYFLKRTRGE